MYYAVKNSIRFSVKLYDLFLSFSDGENRKKGTRRKTNDSTERVFRVETVEIFARSSTRIHRTRSSSIEKHDELELLSGAGDR